MRRRSAGGVLALLLAASGAASGAACGTARSGTAARDGELIVGADADEAVTGAFQARLGVYPLNVNVAESLTRLTPDFRVEPLLATRWEYAGANTWRFHLRRGVRFHDGQPFDARAVQGSLALAVRGGLGNGLLTPSSARVVDDSTVDVTTTRPNLRLPEELVHPNYAIFAPGTDPARRPVGTGPFRFAEYRPTERFVVTRNDAYWGAGASARLRRITFRFFPDANTRVLALLAGEVDLVMDLPREQVRVIDARPNLTVVRAPVGQAMTLDVNAHGKAPHDLLSDRTLRRALALALDRRQLVRVVLAGEASEVQGMTVPAVLGPYAARVQGFAYDTARAQALLDSAGWRRGADGVRRKGGRALALTLLANPELEPAVPEFVQAELRAIGIPLRWVRLPDLASYAARNNAGEFDLNLSVPNQNDGDPLFLPALIFHSKSQRPFARWHSVGERFDRLVDEGLRAVDPEEARRLAAEAMHEAVDVEAIAIPVAGRFRLYAMKREVRGFAPHPAQTHQSWSTVSVGGAAPVASAR